MARGGARPNSGPEKGSKHAATISKEMAREEARKYIQAHMPRMLFAQVGASCGLAHLMLRNEDGTFAKAPANMSADTMLAVLNGPKDLYYIATKDPSTQAFNTLAAYALDKPKEQDQTLNVNVTELGAKLDAARLAAAKRNKGKA